MTDVAAKIACNLFGKHVISVETIEKANSLTCNRCGAAFDILRWLKPAAEQGFHVSYDPAAKEYTWPT